MDFDLKGRTAIVTGGSKGIGKSIAKSLALEGVNVAICARGSESLLSAQKEINELSGNVITILTDGTKPESVQSAIKKVIEQFGGIDILVNNTGGVDKFGDFLELTHDDWRKAFELNVMTIVCFVQYTLAWLRKSTSPRIINISSISGLQPGYYNPHYTTTKAAVINLSKYLSNQFVQDQILVNVVCAGPVHSHSWDKNVQRIADMQNIPLEISKSNIEVEESDKIPLGRVGEGDDISGLVTFLASSKASWITGSCFHVNGGKLRTIF